VKIIAPLIVTGSVVVLIIWENSHYLTLNLYLSLTLFLRGEGTGKKWIRIPLPNPLLRGEGTGKNLRI
jgi:hypothetical protein